MSPGNGDTQERKNCRRAECDVIWSNYALMPQEGRGQGPLRAPTWTALQAVEAAVGPRGGTGLVCKRSPTTEERPQSKMYRRTRVHWEKEEEATGAKTSAHGIKENSAYRGRLSSPKETLTRQPTARAHYCLVLILWAWPWWMQIRSSPASYVWQLTGPHYTHCLPLSSGPETNRWPPSLGLCMCTEPGHQLAREDKAPEAEDSLKTHWP